MAIAPHGDMEFAMIECPRCGLKCPDDALFCGNCAQSLAPKDEDPFIGLCIDNKYYITKRISAGGMGVVYLAKQKGVEQYVAIKKLHAEFYRDKVIVERFMDEARSYGRITHPNAVKLHDLLNVNGQICIVMEFVAGKTLTHYIESGHVFSLRQIVDISLQLADALGTVHRAGIIHRDLKTENVMLMETVPGRFSVKILDFGIAKMLDKPVDRKTKEGIIVGTPEFMSPEQCYGTDVDWRTDIYAFGILMFVMLCGRLPYVSDSPMGLLQMQIHAPIPDLVRPNGESVPEGLKRIVQKCMMKSRDERYASFAEVIADLTKLQEGGMASFSSASDGGMDQLHTRRIVLEEESARGVLSGKTAVDSSKRGAASEPFAFEWAEDDDEAPSELLSEASPDDASGLDIGMDSASGEDGHGMESEHRDEAKRDDSEGYSLGDILDIEAEDAPPSLNTPKKRVQSHARHLVVGLVVAIVILGLILGGILYDRRASGDLEAADVLGEKSLQEVESAPDVRGDKGETEAPFDAPQGEDSGALREENGIQAVEPIAASQLVTHEMLMRGVARACLSEAVREANDGALESSQTHLACASAYASVLSSADAEALEGAQSHIQAMDEIWRTAQTAGQNCRKIEALTERIPESAAGLKARVAEAARKCQKKLEAPPTLL